jgi:hypothetical protein
MAAEWDTSTPTATSSSGTQHTCTTRRLCYHMKWQGRLTGIRYTTWQYGTPHEMARQVDIFDCACSTNLSPQLLPVGLPKRDASSNIYLCSVLPPPTKVMPGTTTYTTIAPAYNCSQNPLQLAMHAASAQLLPLQQQILAVSGAARYTTHAPALNCSQNLLQHAMNAASPQMLPLQTLAVPGATSYTTHAPAEQHCRDGA